MQEARDTPPPPPRAKSGVVSIDDFAKLDLRAAKVLEATRVEGSDKLLQLKLDLGHRAAQCVLRDQRGYDPETSSAATW